MLARVPWSAALVGAIVLVASPARAHIRLVTPTTRYPIPDYDDGSNLKDAPCGVKNDQRTADPQRITTFSPGQTITLTWKETINHPGHFRIVFDDDGQDAFTDPSSYEDIQTTPTLPILLDGIPDNNTTNGAEISAMVTLPNVNCENCTLQVIQIMTDKAPYALGGDDVYHQCADIVIAGPLAGSGGAGGAGSGGAGGSGGSFGSDAGTSGVGGSAGATAGGTGSGSGGAGQGGAKGGSSNSDAPEEGGCSLVRSGQRSVGVLGALAALAGLGLVLRRRPA